MNIKSIINPLIFGRESVDDSAWEIKVTHDNSGSKFNIRCINTFLSKTRTSAKKTMGFCLILSIDSNLELEFRKISLIGKIKDPINRLISTDDIYKLFKKSIEDNLQVKD